MLADVVGFLQCPICAGPLALTDRTLGCVDGHTFDVHRHGYAHLAAGPLRHKGDTAEMVSARVAFLDAGHYQPITAALATAAADVGQRAPLILDAGAGPAHHLAAVLAAVPQTPGLALDVSRPAMRLAARTHPRIAAVLCDTWAAMPLRDNAVGLLINVFAPRNGPEFRRVLQPDGALIVVTPTATHLMELAEPLRLLAVDPAKQRRLAGTLEAEFTRIERADIHYRMTLTKADVRNLLAMGPNAWHRTAGEAARAIQALPEPVDVTASVHVDQYRRR